MCKWFIFLFLLGGACAEEWANTTQYMDSVLGCFSVIGRADADELVIPTLEKVHFVVLSGDAYVRVEVDVHNKTKISGLDGLRRKLNCSNPVWYSANEEFGGVPPWFDGRDVIECTLYLPVLHIRYEGSVRVGNGAPVEIRVSVKGKQADVRTVVGTIAEPNTENVGVWISSDFVERKIAVVADGEELPEPLTERIKEFFLDFANRNKHYYLVIERLLWKGLDQCIRKKPLVPLPSTAA